MKYSGFRSDVKRHVLTFSTSGQRQVHSRSQSLRSFWPAAGIERLWEQPFQACAIDEDFVKPDGQNSVIFFVISKWLLPELSIPATGQKDRGLWGRECSRFGWTSWSFVNFLHAAGNRRSSLPDRLCYPTNFNHSHQITQSEKMFIIATRWNGIGNSIF